MVDDDETPERIGRFPVVRRLGHGGMGVVYEARDEDLGRRLAIKVLHRGAEEKGKLRFVREARAIAAVAHPNVATIFEVGEFELEDRDGGEAEVGRYLAMEFIEGRSLRELLGDGSLPLERALEIARGVLNALSAAHDAGLVHRDLKPENVMLAAKSGRAKVLDFGLAKSMARLGLGAKDQDLVALSQGLTSEASIVGSPAYMSPEQIKGGELGPSSDLFSFGSLFYEMLAGERPFAGDGSMELLVTIVTGDPKPLEDYRPDLSPDLRDLVMQCLRNDPKDRPASAAALRAALEKHQIGQVAGESASGNHGTWWRWGIGLALVGAVLAVTVGPLLVPGDPEEGEPTESITTASSSESGLWVVAVLPFEVTGPDQSAYLGEAMSRLLATKLELPGAFATLDPRAVGNHLEASGEPDEIGAAARALGATHFVLGSVVSAGGRIEVVAVLHRIDGPSLDPVERHGEEDELFSVAEGIAAGLLAQHGNLPNARLNRAAAAGTTSVAAMRAYLEGEQAYRATSYELARNSFRRAVAEDPAFALAHYRLSVASGWLDETADELEALNAAIARSERLTPRDLGLVEAYQAFLRSDYADAVRRYRAHVQSYPTGLEAWVSLAEAQFQLGPLNGRPRVEARPSFERVLELEPDNSQALEHLIQLSVGEEDAEAVERLVARLPEDSRPPYAVVHALLHGDDDALAALSATEPTRHPGVIDLPRLEGQLYLSEHLPDRPALQARLRLGYEIAHGHLVRALELFDVVAGQAEAGPAEAFALILLLPASGATDSQVEHSCAAAAAAGAAASDGPPTPLHTWHAGVRPQVQAFLGAACAHRLGAVRARERALERLVALPEADGFERLGPTLVAQVEAWKALDEGDPGRAVTLLTIPTPFVPIGQALASPVLSGGLGAYVRAEALIALDGADDARSWLLSILRATLESRSLAPYVHRRAGRIAAESGRVDEARSHYERYLELRIDADSELESEVTAVRAALASLGN